MSKQKEIFLNKTRWIIFSLLTVGALAILVIFSSNSKTDVSKIDVNAIQPASSQNGNIGDHVIGNVDSKVTLIEYADYQCGGCATVYPMIKSVVDEYKDKIKFIFRNYPLTDGHPNAKAAAGTVEAAGLQGKFWEMQDKVYSSQSDWSDLSAEKRAEFFEGLAKDLGLDLTKFNADLTDTTSSTSINAKINFDLSLGKKSKIEGTPALYLNGVYLKDMSKWSDATKLKGLIDKVLK